MVFELESPASEETLSRCDWEKTPLLYESIGKKLRKKPLSGVSIDRQGLVFNIIVSILR
jgi:hypothetical protein